MSSKKRQDQYTAGLVSKPFWFYEYKAYVNELLNGSSADEIRSSAFEKHLFSAANRKNDKHESTFIYPEIFLRERGTVE